jgi:hypothetical protein
MDGQRRAGHRPAILTASVLDAASGLLFGSSDLPCFQALALQRPALAGIH